MRWLFALGLTACTLWASCVVVGRQGWPGVVLAFCACALAAAWWIGQAA